MLDSSNKLSIDIYIYICSSEKIVDLNCLTWTVIWQNLHVSEVCSIISLFFLKVHFKVRNYRFSKLLEFKLCTML